MVKKKNVKKQQIRKLFNELKKQARAVAREASTIQRTVDSVRDTLGGKTAKTRKGMQKDLLSAKEDKEKTKSAKYILKYDSVVHKLQKGDVNASISNIKRLSTAVNDAKYIVREAKKVQQKAKR